MYPAPLRDLLLELAVSDVFQARWSVTVLEEMRRNILEKNPHIEPSKIDRTIALMNSHTRDCCVDYKESLVESIEGLKDDNDRHVVAAALTARCHAIVTRNLKDFPNEALQPYRLEAIDPDEFISAQFDLNQGLFMEAVSTVRGRLSKPAFSSDEYLSLLTRQGLVQTATLLKPLAKFI